MRIHRYGVDARINHPGWLDEYRSDWAEEHPNALQRGHFAMGAVDDYWITETPDWDRQWFIEHGMEVPCFGCAAGTYWRDCGDGLRGLSYAEPWVDRTTYETLGDGPAAAPILVGAIGICLAVLTISLLIGALA